MKELEYPFDSLFILRKRKTIKRLLEEYKQNSGSVFITKRIAFLGGSSTHDIREILELFLLNVGIEPLFYESEYAQYWQDIMFDNEGLDNFKPDLIFIHTSSKNINKYPTVYDSDEVIRTKLEEQYNHFEIMWKKIQEKYHCPIIQNNFEQPYFRLMGNKDVSDIHGRNNFINRLNQLFYLYAQNNNNFFINDINYLASSFGLQRWADPSFWYLYKYILNFEAIPEFAYNLANIIKSIYGKNKKVLMLDLDNTLWGGIVGDDGAENIEIGQETAVAEIYTEFQQYLKAHKGLGVLLTINSKNEKENAIAGLTRPDSVLKPEDFIVIKANWNPKSQNANETAEILNLGVDSFVFVDDNPAEREIIKANIKGIAVPEITSPENYINILDRCGFFEVTNFSNDDLKRNEMYKANIARETLKSEFTNYSDFLLSLQMQAEIGPFVSIYMSRIAQLTNKSNQFNLTTKRCTQAEIEKIAADKNYITLYGKLEDKFGDNGVVSIVFGHIDKDEKDLFHIDLWLMSCRVLKRDMEYAMLDKLVQACKKNDIKRIKGYYFPTQKNKMVKNFYETLGFDKEEENGIGDSTWILKNIVDYKNKNKVIKIKGE